MYDANCCCPCTALHFRVSFYLGCCLCRQQTARPSTRFWNRANVEVSLSGSSIACYRLVSFSSSCLQPLTEDHPDVSLLSPNPPTHFLCPQRAAVHREAWPHATHTQPRKHNIPPHTHNTNILTQTFSLSVPTLDQTRIFNLT